MATENTTMAERVSALLKDDGGYGLKGTEGITPFDRAVAEVTGKPVSSIVYGPDYTGDIRRVSLPDGSALLLQGAYCWDVAITGSSEACLCMPGSVSRHGHEEGCPDLATTVLENATILNAVGGDMARFLDLRAPVGHSSPSTNALRATVEGWAKRIREVELRLRGKE